MKRTCLLLALGIGLVVTSLAVSAPSPTTPLEAAQLLLGYNLALGDRYGQSPTADTVARLDEYVTQGLSHAREAVSTDPRRAEAHRLLGLLLTVTYRSTGAKEGAILLRRGSADPAEVETGLEELLTAIKLQPLIDRYRLDYIWALLLTGHKAIARDELRLLMPRATYMFRVDRTRLTQLQQLARELETVAVPPQPTPISKAESSQETVPPAPPRITWVPFEQALSQAAQEQKRVLVDFMAEWCGWCKKLDTDVYTDPSVIALSRDFVFSKVDAEKHAKLAEKYQVTGFPTIVIMDSSGRELTRIIGYKPAHEFLAAVQ